MFLLDVFVRFSGLGILLIMVINILMLKKVSVSYKLLLYACLSVFCLFLGFSPEYVELSTKAKFIVRLFDIPHLVFVWLFALSLFQKDFQIKKYHVVIFIIYCFPIVVVRLGQFEVLPQAHYFWYLFSSLFSIGLMAHLIAVTLYGKEDDLVEKRRNAREYFVALICFITFGVATSEIFLIKENLHLLYTVKVAVIWLGILWAVLWLLKLNESQFSWDSKDEPIIEFTERDKCLINRLETQLVKHEVYLDPKLTLVLLAKKIGVSPNKLRELINRKLGYQNFSSFMNHYRIENAKSILRDPSKSDIPILTLALESGFSSLSPFNKAFKSKENMPPSEYRKKHKSLICK